MTPNPAPNESTTIRHPAASMLSRETLASLAAPPALTMTALLIAYLADKIASATAGETLVTIAVILTMTLPTIGLIPVIIKYRRPHAVAAGMALVNLVWYTLTLTGGGDAYNYMDWLSSLALIGVEEALNLAPGPVYPLVAAIVSYAIWLAIGKALVRAVPRP